MLSLRNTSIEFLKFSVVGIFNTVAGYAIYYVLLFYHLHYLAALLISYIFGILNNYYLNRYWVFASEHHFKRELPRFIIVFSANILLNVALLPVFVELLKFDPRIAQLFLQLCLAMLTFLGLKFWSFQ